jgi:hypothetical protein
MATTQTIVVCGCVDCWSNPTLSRADGGGLQKTTRTLASGCPCYRLDEAACRIHRHLEFRGRPNEPALIRGHPKCTLDVEAHEPHGWRRRTGDCHGEAAAARSYVGTSKLAFV